jgi:hypothetical protein
MSKIVTLTESELVGLVKKFIFESMGLEFYTNEDFMDAYLTLFREWASKNLDEKHRKYPISFLIKTYGDRFEKETSGESFNSKYDKGLSHYRIKNYITKLVNKGLFSPLTMQPEEKFTEKYSKFIPMFLERINLPEYVDLEFQEHEPNVVHVYPKVDFEKQLVSDKPLFDKWAFLKKIQHYFENYLGVEFGNPVYGQVSLTVSEPEIKGIDEWIKNVFNKKIKKDIKKMPFGSLINRIRLEKTDQGKIKMHVYRSSWSTPRKDFVDGINAYLANLGYNSSKFLVDIN